MGYLTTSMKDRLRPVLLLRDGIDCLYCHEPLSPLDFESSHNKVTVDHLDNDVKHNDRENLVLCHNKCNQAKKSYPDYQIIARAKAEQLRVTVAPLSESEAATPKPASKEIDINVAAKKLTWQYLQDRLVRQGKPALNFNDAAHSISFILWQQIGHGSSETIKRYLNDFCSSAAPFKTQEEGGETIILKRT